jgi:hypothetical protein
MGLLSIAHFPSVCLLFEFLVLLFGFACGKLQMWSAFRHKKNRPFHAKFQAKFIVRDKQGRTFKSENVVVC